jgi:hypothetical protein
MECLFAERREAWQPSLKVAQSPHDGQNKNKALVGASLVSTSITCCPGTIAFSFVFQQNTLTEVSSKSKCET